MREFTRYGLATTIVTAFAMAACGPAPQVDVIGVRTATVFPREEAPTLLGSLRPAVGGGVNAVRYAVEPQTRIYLIRQNLDLGIDTIDGAIPTLRFPVTTAWDPTLPTTIATGADQDWLSAAVYDVGECSLFVPWLGLQLLINGRVEQLLLDLGTFGTQVQVRTTPGEVNIGPILERANTYASRDAVRYNGFLFSNSAGGCGPAIVAFETRYEVTSVGNSLTDRLCGGVIPGASGLDFGLQNLEARAEVSGDCIVEDRIENGVVGAFGTRLPEQFGALLLALTSLTAAEAGVTPGTTCGCDAECGPRLPFADPRRGPRSVCRDGMCDVRVEIDRVFVMPEGIQIVFAEDPADGQRAIMTAVAGHIATVTGGGLSLGCDPARAPSTNTGATSPTAVRVLPVTNPPDIADL